MNRIAWIAMVLICGAWGPVAGQEVSLRFQQPPYFVDEPVVVQIVADNFDGKQDPECRLVGAAPEGLVIEGPEVDRRFREFFQSNFNGRTTTRQSVTYIFQFVVRASSAGRYEVGPFTLDYGGRQHTLDARSFEFKQLADDTDMDLKVELPESVYVGQRVPVTVEWAMSGAFHEIQYAFRNLEIRSPLFDQCELIAENPGNNAALSIATAKGAVAVGTTQRTEDRAGREHIVLRGNFELIVRSPGEFRDQTVTCRTRRGYNWRRRFLGGAAPDREEPARRTTKLATFRVKPLPRTDQPASFAGAVGAGFGIEVAANRTVVRVGDPISLTVSLTGQGIEKLSLPDLMAAGGLPPEQFQVPREPAAGTYDGRVKQFKLNVRVKDEAVERIPEIEYSWFDPQKEAYVSARSKPIALQVMPAQWLGAEDVVSARPPEDTPKSSPLQSLEVALAARGVNLAIEKDIDRLRGQARGWLGGPFVRWGSYGLGMGAVLLAVLLRRMGDADPELARRRQEIRGWLREMETAPSRPGKAGFEQLAQGLRKFAALAEAEQRAPLDRLIAQCEEAIYAPGESQLPPDLAKQARKAVADIQ